MNLIPKIRSFMKEQSDTSLRVHYKDQTCTAKLSKELERVILKASDRPLVLVCIGTDRSTGDSLGPIIGSRLNDSCLPNVHIFGTLDQPVHAINLKQTYEQIHSTFNHPFIIGIDACLGRYNNIGVITLGDGPVLPGAGVNKQLPPIGDIHLTGIVNVGGYMEYMVLQNTRLYLVMAMAEKMSHALITAISNTIHRDPPTKINVLSLKQ
ncbi:spore protease YyaC [Pullulanibacillus sp. KACC 23026]|uniref:spore protease YyaC n=1 Tax=Pullulanibacillus sp. KACC 23026 TaxID=3028315 RepID=UPI0023AF9C2E|nr:spore protease YyaC [Pullulanibacillus sp. KACC 23026]WEG12793.1 spore protease YyaC [Pullulanibacillus sp. KACC 23026]